ncbi:Cyclic AMP-dependent transcription factor ATF-4 [Larimichthys crocea]|uniref:Cyclic AMP-dependent transcription factor ATF-4 n=1 Tax=Larimichthys crocea TaxID=215358 RepID=A0A6G0HVC0_LARCR|nr:Cyclic AMP-dependent transcription factor ATF-4 [Larimichthys crocea]
MTMMMTNSQFGLEDMEVHLWGPSSPMADPMDLLPVRPDREELQDRGGASLEGDTSPVSPLTSSSLSSSSSPPPFYSPPPSPPAVLFQGDKVGMESDLPSLPWLGHPGQLRQSVSYGSKEDMFSDLDWMAERVDLSELDLDFLIGSCSPTHESPSSPEDLLASLDVPMELDSLPVPTLSTPVLLMDEPEPYIDEQDVPTAPLCVPEPQEELEIKSEPASPDPSSPLVESPSSPVYTLDLGSEVDVSESEVKPAVATVIPQVQRVVLSLSPTRIVLVLAPKKEVAITTATVTTTPEVVHSSSPTKSTRSRPYPEPTYKSSPPSTSGASVRVKSLRGGGGEERVTPKAPKAKKLKKMEQNKTAATRYRQKKKTEQEALLQEHAVLERKNMELNEKAESMAREIEYLKELMEEVQTARTKKGLSATP